MKIRATINLDIDLTPEDIIAGIQDKEFEEFRKKLDEVAGEYHKGQLTESQIRTCTKIVDAENRRKKILRF